LPQLAGSPVVVEIIPPLLLLPLDPLDVCPPEPLPEPELEDAAALELEFVSPKLLESDGALFAHPAASNTQTHAGT
jgi:hypothetical protein